MTLRPWKVLHRGRWTVFLSPPVYMTTERSHDDDGWLFICLAWGWRKPARWRFPTNAADARCPTLIRGFVCGPLDVRRASR